MKLILFLCLFSLTTANIYLNFIDTVIRIIKKKSEEIIDRTGHNTQCANDLKILLKDLILREKWVFEMLDASGRPTTGMLTGNIYGLGNFDQCLDIHVEKNDTVLEGQYCTVILTPSPEYSNDASALLDLLTAANYLGLSTERHTQQVVKLMKVTYGLCIPKSCTISNLQTTWDYIEHAFKVPVHVSFVDLLCRNKSKPVEPYSIDKFVNIAFGVYISFLLLVTLYDILCHQMIEGDVPDDSFLRAFSFYTNGRKLFSSVHNLDESTALKCISGIKVISMFWIVFGHRVVLNIFSPNINSRSIFEWWKNIENTPIMATSFAVDTFLMLSGFLLSFLFLKNQHLMEGRRIPILLFYLYRILRLTPALLATVLFYVSIFKNLADGPLWPLISKKVAASCYYFGWATLLFVTNLIPMPYQCIEQSWYLAVDSQLYFVSPFILNNLEKYPGKTILTCAAACVVSIVYSYVITIQNSYGAMFYEGDKEYFHNIYLPTFVRMPTWMIGIVMGYLTYKYQQISISNFLNMFTWVFSLGMMVFIVLVHVIFARSSYDVMASAVFNSCARPVWALSVSLVVFLCMTGHGGVINTFLTLPLFQVLARLTYSMFLVHLGTLLYLTGRKKSVGYFSNLNTIHEFIGDLFFSILIATGWCLAFETPFINIGKILMQKGLAERQSKLAVVKRKSSWKKKTRKNYVVGIYKHENTYVKKCE